MLIACLLTGCLFLSCNRTSKSGTQNSINAYIYAHTSGTISKADPIRIRFANSVVNGDQIGDLVEEKILSFSPNIEGVASWEDESTLYFQPEEWLQSGQVYTATVKVNKLVTEASGSDKSFDFEFRTKDQFFNVFFDGFNDNDEYA